ncbi:glyoxalase/bleomycin resistance/extradiol dioxygenase family protein [Aphanothece hegewaldii CCALA 016]|uniref:Glyoxalase/bleomycin resistance/extradiol dioxygenase family protein n=1 Tax=Aphanothece hegewaldii CCALA 016 TaxID=2107694 RepID=A0A2T1LT81_9CHRO|nr:VOC family protein [Aphanothece hegewaldii]PSF33628.1 glyoxalase/bleomycin resistance/extradiol dioxygenase family protein [Aphanothece hegewaldii CCALA 016]
MHHASIRTANIHRAIAFYETLGFTVTERFTAGYTLACWMKGLGGRIELIQIPEPKPAPDAFNDEHYVGYYHLSFDLTDTVTDLSNWLNDLKKTFIEASQQDHNQYTPLKVLLEPRQQMIGDSIYEVAFIADTDNLPLEFIRVYGKISL